MLVIFQQSELKLHQRVSIWCLKAMAARLLLNAKFEYIQEATSWTHLPNGQNYSFKSPTRVKICLEFLIFCGRLSSFRAENSRMIRHFTTEKNVLTFLNGSYTVFKKSRKTIYWSPKVVKLMFLNFVQCVVSRTRWIYKLTYFPVCTKNN